MNQQPIWYLHCYTSTCFQGFPANTYYSSKLEELLEAIGAILNERSNSGITGVSVTRDKLGSQAPQPLFMERTRELQAQARGPS